MQSLEVISVNIWHILISLCNLLILFLIVKRFLFKPVKKALEKRDADIGERYSAANEAKRCGVVRNEVDFHTGLTVHVNRVVEVKFIESGTDIGERAHKSVLHKFDVVLKNVDFAERIVHKSFQALHIK